MIKEKPQVVGFRMAIIQSDLKLYDILSFLCMA